MSLLFAGIFSGFLVGVLVLETSLRDYDRTVYAQVRQVELDALDILATATLVPALLATAFLLFAVFRAKGPALWLPLAAFVLLLIVFVVSLTVNVPINGDQADWDVQAPPSDWADVRDRWQAAHVVRTVSAVLAFGLLAFSTLGRKPADEPAAAA
ncbi:anthrone oxygenase family protein [Streptomyces sp. URMC 129]